MTKRNCFVTQVGDAIEALATALDPQRKPPFKGDILDLLEWAEKDVLELRQRLDAARAEAAHVKEVEFPRRVAIVAENWRKKLDAKQAEVDALMLEYCPSEMSQEQLDNWAAHQRPVEELK